MKRRPAPTFIILVRAQICAPPKPRTLRPPPPHTHTHTHRAPIQEPGVSWWQAYYTDFWPTENKHVFSVCGSGSRSRSAGKLQSLNFTKVSSQKLEPGTLASKHSIFFLPVLKTFGNKLDPNLKAGSGS